MKWQPIETAPKDRPVLNKKHNEMGIGIYDRPIFGQWRLCFSVSFFINQTQSNLSNHALPKPTHWMELPAFEQDQAQ
jgi:hypothetical protein